MSETPQRRRVAILGASGYGGGELLRLLADHPAVEVVAAAAATQVGKPIASVHPQLRGIYSIRFCAIDEALASDGLDVVFLALPHGESHRLVPRIAKRVRVIDLSGDFRLRDPKSYAQWYGQDHAATTLIPDFVYGLSEWFGPHIAETNRIANPGCFATAVLMGLLPLVAADLVAGTVIIDAKTGSSGSGASPSVTTHHPVRAHGLNAYKPFAHQHEPEILQTLAAFGKAPEILFQAHSVPLVRGIYASIYVPLNQDLTAERLGQVFQERYQSAPFVRLCDGPPNVAWVQGSNYTDIGWAIRRRHASVFVAIDNLVKGAAGQAIQNLNRMLRLPETTGIRNPGLLP